MKRNCRQAFSLVEVVLAMGVVSFALLGMVALIPNALRMSHEAADATAESQIIQFVRNQLQLTTYANLSAWAATPPPPLYFDKDGLPSTSTDPNHIYTAALSVGNVTMVDSNDMTTDLPANSAQDVQVVITNRTTAGSSATHTYSIVVPNSGS